MIVTSPTTRICPLSESPIAQSAFLPCGHEFERPSISTWLASGGTECPRCRTVCSIREIADTPEGATEKAKQFVQEKVEHIQIGPNITFAQALEIMLQKSVEQFSSIQRFKNEDANRLHQLFMTRVFIKFAQNLDPFKATLPHMTMGEASKSERLQFEMGFQIKFLTYMTAMSSPLLLHALIEDNAMHNMIVPPAYPGLSPCPCPVSSRELDREYMLCERIQRLERDVMLADNNIEVSDLSPDILPSMQKEDLSPLGQVLAMFEVLQRMSPHSRDQYGSAQLNTAQNIRKFYPFWYERFQVHKQQQSDRDSHLEEELCASMAFTRVEVEFLLSALLISAILNEGMFDRDERSLTLKILERLGEQIPHPLSDDKVTITHRLYQILGELLPAEEEESPEERGRVALPLLFDVAHPTAILYAIAQLRTELHAYWQFSDTADYQQEWTDLQEKMKTQGHL